MTNTPMGAVPAIESLQTTDRIYTYHRPNLQNMCIAALNDASLLQSNLSLPLETSSPTPLVSDPS